MFQILNTRYGYVVQVYREFGPNCCFYAWVSIANFGDNQGDARFFKDYDAPRLTEKEIQSLISNYDETEIWRKLATGHYQRSSTTNSTRV